MTTPATTLTQLELKSAIVRAPLLVTAETTVLAAIAQMSGVRAICAADQAEGYSDNIHQEARSSCVLVVEGEKVLGILTERDIVRLSAQQRSLEAVTVREVMASPVVTLQETDFTDLFSAVNLLLQHRIRHMPILDDAGQLLGVITHESLRQLARPVDLLRLRLVSEVMTADVIWAEPSSSMLAIAQLMANHRVGSVLVVEPRLDPAGNPLQIPLGIITERDIVQFQSLGLQLDQIEVQVVMSTPVFTVRPEDSLMVVQQIMEQRSIRRLVVTGTQGELLGVVTQTSLLQALNPLELYSLSQILQQKVAQLEAEKTRLLENYTAELERQVAERTAEIKAQAEREQVVARIALCIQQSLELDQILETTVTEVRQLLAADRVLIYQFQPDMSGTIVTESVLPGWTVTLDQQIQDTCFQQNAGGDYRSGKIHAIADIDQAGLTPCYRQLLEQFQVKANLVAPILVGGQLWGLLIAHQCSAPRQWQSVEVELLDQLVVQIAIALQQTTAYQQMQAELEKRQQIEATLRKRERRYATLTEMSPVGIFQTNAEGHCLYVNERWCQIAGLRPAEAEGFGWVNGIHLADRDPVAAEWYASVQENRPFSLEYRFLNAAGQITWVYGQSVSERDEAGEIVGYVGTITDITKRKQIEQALLDINLAIKENAI